MFTNAAALYLFYHPINMSWTLGIIINIVIIIGVIAGISRLFKFPLVAQFYQIGWVVSSAITGILLLYGMNL